MRKYVNDYKSNGQGYEYTKEWYKITQDMTDVKKQAVLWMCEALFLTLLLIVGLSVSNAGNNEMWIVMPYVSAAFSVYYLWRGCITLYFFCKKQMKNDTERTDGSKKAKKVAIPPEFKDHMLRSEYEEGIVRPARCAAFLVFLTGISLIADIIFLITRVAEINIGTELVFGLDVLLMLVTSLILLKQTRITKKAVLKVN